MAMMNMMGMDLAVAFGLSSWWNISRKIESISLVNSSRSEEHLAGEKQVMSLWQLLLLLALARHPCLRTFDS
jgi:hypothetical protein